MAEETRNLETGCRMSIDLTAKGLAQWGISVRYATPEETGANLKEAIDLIRAALKEKGLVEAGTV
jgi:hypothetical protein